MGQYYNALLERNGKRTVYDITVNGEFQGLKITEHSWFRNSFMSAIAQKIFKKPTRIIWCGDYAEDEELQVFSSDLTVDKVYGTGKGITCKNLNLDILQDKYLVNHDKQIYIDLNRYTTIAEEFNKENGWEGWYMNPISLLTAVGNNRGGGDYFDGDNTTCFDKVGTWAYDLISLETKPPKGYIEDKYTVFTEHVCDKNRHLIEVYGLTQSAVQVCG